VLLESLVFLGPRESAVVNVLFISVAYIDWGRVSAEPGGLGLGTGLGTGRVVAHIKVRVCPPEGLGDFLQLCWIGGGPLDVAKEGCGLFGGGCRLLGVIRLTAAAAEEPPSYFLLRGLAAGNAVATERVVALIEGIEVIYAIQVRIKILEVRPGRVVSYRIVALDSPGRAESHGRIGALLK